MLLLVCAALALSTKWGSTKTGPAIPGRILHPRNGRLEQTLRVSGTMTADRAMTLLAPRMRGRRSRSSGSRSDFQIILQKMATPGIQVKPGDLVAEFDRQYMLSRLDDYRADVAQRRAVTQRVEAGIAIRRKVLDQRLLVARANAGKARLNMRTVPVRSAIQAENLRLQLEEAEAYLRQLAVEERYFDASERAELRREQLRLAEEEMELRRAETNADKLRVVAPIAGIVVPARIRRGQEYGEVEPGDEIRSGYPYLQLMDPGSLVLSAAVNQADSDQLRLGMRARIFVDAIPEVAIPARVTAVGSLAVANRYRPDWVRLVNIKVKPDRQDPRIYPNFTGSAELVLGEARGLIVPLECVSENEEESRLRIWDGQRASVAEVELGMRSATEVVVTEGLEGGEDLVCGGA